MNAATEGTQCRAMMEMEGHTEKSCLENQTHIKTNGRAGEMAQ